jgi:ketopantoate hydroxymethyltransferase
VDLNLKDYFKNKKQKKEKILMFSFINNFSFDFYLNYNIDILRFDIDEFAYLNGYNDSKKVFKSTILPLLKNLNKNDNIKIAVDLPLEIIIGDNRLKNILSFYKESNADILVIKLEQNINNLISELERIKIPFIISTETNVTSDNLLKSFFNQLIELENCGCSMIVLSGFPNVFIEQLKNSISIPVISSENKSKNDGFYGKYSSIYGFDKDSKIKYLNMSDLLSEAAKDCIIDISKNIL